MKTWATLPVIVARPTCSRGRSVAQPCSHRTRSAPGLVRATASDASAGSTGGTVRPRRASRQAKVPVPQPMSSTLWAPNSSTMAA
jgi:hypothetical protein